MSTTPPRTMIGYKIAKNGDKRVVVTLEIPSDALTNMGRSSIAVRETAKYRANKAIILKIEDVEGNCYETATSFNYDKKSLAYKVGELLEEPSYNMNPEAVCAAGIHFFLDRHVAELYGREMVVNGLYQVWYANGQKREETTYVNGKRNGLYQMWYANGQKCEEYTYVDEKRHGLYQSWYENGQKCEEYTYVDEEDIRGLYQSWHENGQKCEEATYIDGGVQGLYQYWNEDGTINEEITFIDGVRQ
jgi:antitoxin component YwqK of YwqJK toxin-antitoxin module